MNARAVPCAAQGGFESDTLKGVSTLAYELRSFAQGARDALDQIAQAVYNRALLDSRLAVQTAEYLLRRAIFDSGRILSAASSAVAALSAAPPSTMAGGAAPFERMLGRISTTRSLSAAPTAADAADLGSRAAAEEETQAAQDRAAAERQAAMREEAGSLLREAVSAVEIWARNAAKNESASARDAAPAAEAEEIDWELCAPPIECESLRTPPLRRSRHEWPRVCAAVNAGSVSVPRCSAVSWACRCGLDSRRRARTLPPSKHSSRAASSLPSSSSLPSLQ